MSAYNIYSDIAPRRRRAPHAGPGLHRADEARGVDKTDQALPSARSGGLQHRWRIAIRRMVPNRDPKFFQKISGVTAGPLKIGDRWRSPLRLEPTLHLHYVSGALHHRAPSGSRVPLRPPQLAPHHIVPNALFRKLFHISDAKLRRVTPESQTAAAQAPQPATSRCFQPITALTSRHIRYIVHRRSARLIHSASLLLIHRIIPMSI